MAKLVVPRRLVLRGAGGFTLGLPILPSLLVPRGALGQPAFAGRARFVGMTTEHGGIRADNMYPAASMLTEKTALLPGHEINHGKLQRRVEGADAVLSPVLKAPAAALTDRLVSKMNVLRGFDIPWYIAHHTGGHLGNYARNDGNGGDGKMMQASPSPTIDQVMAWSPSFYRDLSGIKERSIVTGTRGGFSWNWSNPSSKSGTIQEVRPESGSLSLFNRIFIPPTMPGTAPRKPIVDRVLENYKLLRNGNRRLNTADRQRLDDHMDRLAELQRRLNVTRPASCNNVVRPTDDSSRVGSSYNDPTKSRRKFALYNDVLAAAFMCGTTRIAVLSASDTFATFSGDWHQDVAHKGTTSGQPLLIEGLRNTFEYVFLDLISKLDVEEAPGVTYLDNTLVQWTQESGGWTHDSDCIPIVTAGSAAGFLRTGLYCDYRNLANGSRIRQSDNTFIPGRNTGLTWNRWLATALQALGVPRSEFEKNNIPGYGNPYVSNSYKATYVSGVLDSAGEVAPLLKA